MTIQVYTCIIYMVVDYVLAGKPNSKHDSADSTEDGKSHNEICFFWFVASFGLYKLFLCIINIILADEFLGVYKRAQETPQKKYNFPQTEAQEIGWDTKPLVSQLQAEIDYVKDMALLMEF